jgi:hypothetical protein
MCRLAINPPEHTKHITDIVKFVETSDHEVLVSNAYYCMKDGLERSKLGTRAGYHFRFWFVNVDSAKAFVSVAKGKLEIPPILPVISKT